MNQLAGTVSEILDALDREGQGWRDSLHGNGSGYGVNQQVQQVTLPDRRVFYVEEARPQPSVSVVFVKPDQQG